MLRRPVVSAVLVALALAPVLLARGEEKQESARLKAAAAARAKKDAAAEKTYREALVDARRGMLAELEVALVAAMDEHDLAEANEIDHARKTVERELAALDAGKLPTSHASARAPVAGTYSVRHRDWQGDVTLYEDGRFGRHTWGEKHRYEGTWTFEDGILTLAWSDWPAVRLEPRLGFEEPGSTMVRRKPRDGQDVKSDRLPPSGELLGPSRPRKHGSIIGE